MGTLAPDGRTLLLAMADGTTQVSSIDGGAGRAINMTAGDSVIGWSRDGRAVFVQRSRDLPATVERIELGTGQRSVAGHVPSDDAALGAVANIAVAAWVDEGRSYAYTYFVSTSTLFVVSGATMGR